MSKDQNVVVAVTPNGPIKYSSVREAIASALTSLADPFFVEDRPIDVTYFRGPGLEDFTRGTDPWAFLIARAQPAVEPEKKVKKVRGK